MVADIKLLERPTEELRDERTVTGKKRAEEETEEREERQLI
jgi:hypothetical protein